MIPNNNENDSDGEEINAIEYNSDCEEVNAIKTEDEVEQYGEKKKKFLKKFIYKLKEEIDTLKLNQKYYI